MFKSQYIFNADISEDHAIMAANLIRKIRPDLKIDVWGNPYNQDEDFREHNIFIFGYKNYALVSIPSREMLSTEQFKKIEEVLLNIKEINEQRKNYGGRIWELHIIFPKDIKLDSSNYEDKIDEVIEALKNYINDNYEKSNEIIIGSTISNNKKL